MSIDAGLLLGDRYRLGERIATGGMGEVWSAHDDTLGRDVAVKILKAEYADDPDFRERFRSEARHTAGIAHPGIAQVFDYGEAGGTSYLVMELVAGEPLSALLARESRLTPERTVDVVVQVAAALDAAHVAGVVHRDVKPGNILMTPGGVVKVTDFGIARAIAHSTVTQTGVVLGTAHYLSPEQASGREVTPASDVYSLGVVAYECLAGRRPFTGDSAVTIAAAHFYDEPPALPPDVPEPVVTLIAQAMAKEPAERFRTAAAFGRAAAATQGQLGGDTQTRVLPLAEVTTLTEQARRSRRRRFPVPLLAAAGVALSLVAGASAWTATRPDAAEVPDLRGDLRAAAEKELATLHLDPVVRTRFSPDVAAGRVIEQQPAARTMLHEGDNVTITVSAGPQPVRLPSGLIGRTYDEVAGMLQEIGLTPHREFARSEDALAGTVVGVSPASGLHVGDTVTVTVATEPRKKRDKDEDD